MLYLLEYAIRGRFRYVRSIRQVMDRSPLSGWPSGRVMSVLPSSIFDSHAEKFAGGEGEVSLRGSL